MDRLGEESGATTLLGFPAQPQSDVAQPTVRHRRRVRVLVIAAVAALAVAVPVAAYAALSGGPHRATQAGASTSPSATAPSRSASAPSAAPAPDGRITRDQLKNATIAVPAWPSDAIPWCVSGKVTFSGWYKMISEGSESMSLETPVYADVDGDGAPETLVLLQCGTDATDSQQVLALDRDASGAIVTIGAVAAQTGAVRAICAVRPGADGGVDVQVADFMVVPTSACAPDKTPYAIYQWRTYHLAGNAFHQTGGPTSFPANPKVSDLTASASNLKFVPSTTGPGRMGTMTVTVHNAGHAALASTITAQMVRGTRVSAPANCTATDDAQITEVTCPVPPVAPGASTTLTLHLSIAASATQPAPDFWPNVTVYPVDGYADPDVSNNSGRFLIIFW